MNAAMNSPTEPMLPRTLRLALPLLLALCLPSAVSASQDGAGLSEDQRAAQGTVYRRAALRIERERKLLEYWGRLGEFERRELERRVAAERRPRRARFEGIELRGLAQAQRALQYPADDGPLEQWFDLVDSVDLLVVPGVFAAREEGRGEAMTVTIDALWDSAIDHRDDEGVEVALLWIAPDGTELTARQEPAGVRALETGFEMYIRPPVSQAATWSLVLEVRTRQGVVRSQGVDIECVADLARVRESLTASPAAGGSGSLRLLRGRLEALDTAGLRLAGGANLATWIAAELGGGEAPARFVAEGATSGAAITPHWELSESPESEHVVVLLARGMEHPLDLLTGPIGDAWRTFAVAEDWRVVAAPPLVVGRDVAPLYALVRELRREGATQVLVVARGDAGRVLPGALVVDPLPELSGLVLAETPGAFVPVKQGVATPTLRIETEIEAPAFEELGEPDGQRRTRAALTAPQPFAALSTPELVRRWLGAR